MCYALPEPPRQQPPDARRADSFQSAHADDSNGKASVPRWAKALLAISVLLFLGGLLPAIQFGHPVPGVGDPFKVTPEAARALTGDDRADGSLAKPPPPALLRWSPTLFRLGFGFFVGFAVAFATRRNPRLAGAAGALFIFTAIALRHEGLMELRPGRPEMPMLRVRAASGLAVPDSVLRFVSVGGALAAGLVSGFVRPR